MLFRPAERRYAELAARLARANPFLPERIELERAFLGKRFDSRGADWNQSGRYQIDHPNVRAVTEICRELLATLCARMDAGERPSDAEQIQYRDLAFYYLYQKHKQVFDAGIQAALEGRGKVDERELWQSFLESAEPLLVGVVDAYDEEQLAHLFACYFQIRRAFHHALGAIVGSSRPTTRLRADAWHSVFTHDLDRYFRVLWSKMADYSTLITGPTGSGKELVARVVGLSRYIPFDRKRQRFTEDFAGSFVPINLSALSPTLIESELFGHARGAFTGAADARVGWLERCPPLGSVFLDEIGELDPAIQVKLLRVIEARSFSRLGETKERRFEGKLIAATHRDLAQEMQAGRFRPDLYYRLCSDIVTTPSLAERIRDRREERGELIDFLVTRLLGERDDSVAREVETWIVGELGDDYAWPGNVRELDQCVRNFVVRRAYTPPAQESAGPADQLARDLSSAELTTDELLNRYCQLAVERHGSYSAAARKIGLDRRTVRVRAAEADKGSGGRG